MPFRKYERIPSTYEDDLMSNTMEWIRKNPRTIVAVTEKFHGANFSVEVKLEDSGDISTVWASRNRIVEPGEFEKFYRSDIVVNKYTDNITALARTHPHLTVYGELIGGSYPDIVLSDDKSPSGYPSVQKGVYYTPSIEWVVFDVFDHSMNQYWSTSDVETHMKEYQIPYSRVLFRGTLDDVMYLSQQNLECVSLASFELFGLTPVEGNIREGHVLKVDSGEGILNKYGYYERWIFKHKNDRYRETLPRQIEQLGDIARVYAVPARLDNVISKIPYIPTKKDIGLIIKEFKHDIIMDIVSNVNENITIYDVQLLDEYIHPLAQSMVVDRFV